MKLQGSSNTEVLMNVELQSVVDRLEVIEHESRSWKLLAFVSTLLAAVAVSFQIIGSPIAPRSTPSKFSTVEASRFLLRDAAGRLAGGLEIAGDGAIRLVLGGGYGSMGAAFMEVRPDGITQVTLRGPDGGVRAALLGANTPSLALASKGFPNGVVVRTAENGQGSLMLKDSAGRARFRVR
jgi:hypothetical protein